MFSASLLLYNVCVCLVALTKNRGIQIIRNGNQRLASRKWKLMKLKTSLGLIPSRFIYFSNSLKVLHFLRSTWILCFTVNWSTNAVAFDSFTLKFRIQTSHYYAPISTETHMFLLNNSVSKWRIKTYNSFFFLIFHEAFWIRFHSLAPK